MQKHRISTNIGKDQKVTVELKQDFDVLEILSLKFTQEQVYTSGCSDYGVICGRVSANNGFGLANARVSIFVPQLDEDANDPVISALYPYKEIGDKNADGLRYNLFPSRKQHGGHTPIGSFPDQIDILEREEVLEVYEKYFRYTVKTNNSGDFMIWGVPVGNHQLHVDVDLSDIGCFSLRPADLSRLGRGVDDFQNKYTYKASADLDSLPQVVSFDRNIEVYPFWGNESLCDIAITRADFDTSTLGISIQPKAYIIGGIFTDSGRNTLKKNCTPKRKMGTKCSLEARSGKIEALRFRQERDELNRPYIEYTDLHEDIPDDGSFVMPIEMNLEHVVTNEFGENEITNDPNKGIPTAGVYRFRINMNASGAIANGHRADYLLPNIREFNTNGVIDDKSYYFGSDYSGYPADAQSLILNTDNTGSFYPRDYFYRFQYNKVYTVSSFHSHHMGFTWLNEKTFANITDILPNEEEDCGDKVTPPTNFGVKRYTFPLFIADVLLLIDYVIKLIVLTVLNFFVPFFRTVVEAIISVYGSESTRSLRGAVNSFIANNSTRLQLINYPDCNECEDDSGNCDYYDVPYDDALITGYFVDDYMNVCQTTVTENTDTFIGQCFPENYGRRYIDNIPDLRAALASGRQIVGCAIYGEYGGLKPKSYYPYDNPGLSESRGVYDGNYSGRRRICFTKSDWYTLGITSTTYCFDNGDKVDITLSGRSEFKNGIFYIVPGSQTNRKLRKIVNEYYRRKRVNKMFCGGIVNYGFMDNWLSGSLYFPQFQTRKLARAVELGTESVARYCRKVLRYVFNQNRFYYRSAAYNPTTRAFDPSNLNRPTTFVDLGPRDEFIKEICIDNSLDPNCSVIRNISPTTYQDTGDVLGLAINYRMDLAGDNGRLELFFQNKGFEKASLFSVLDGDILQILSTNNETGIERFDLENPNYVAYRYNVLDPEIYPEFFQKNGNWGPLPVTLELSEDGAKTRLCLNAPGNLTEASQPVPFYLWDKGGEGFGPYTGEKNAQSWDYYNVEVQPLQGMTKNYKYTSNPNEKYLLLPMTQDNGDGLVEALDLTNEIDFDFVTTQALSGTNLTNFQKQYPGYTYLYVTGGTISAPTSGTLYVRYSGDSSNAYQTIPWTSTTDVILPKRANYYNGNKQILSTPFQFYFGLIAGSTGMDKFVDLYGPQGAFIVDEPVPTVLPSCGTLTPTPTPSPTPTLTPTPNPTLTPTPTPTVSINPNGLNLMSGTKSGTTLNSVCNNNGTNVNIYFSGTSIQLGEKLYANNNLPNPTPVIDGYYYYPTYNTVYRVANGLGAVVDTPSCPTPTPIEYTIENVWSSDPLTSNPTEFDLSLAIDSACNSTSALNNGQSFTMTAWGNNICNALRVYNVPAVMLSEVTSNGIVILKQTINNFDGSGGNKTWYRKFQRQLIKDADNRFYFLPIGGCSECGVLPPTPTPIPQVTVNVYGYQTTPYDVATNNVQLIYQTYYSPDLSALNYTTTGFQKILTESGTFLTSITMNAGSYLNLGVFRRVQDGECDYKQINVNVFEAGTFNSTRFNNSTGSLLSNSGCGLQGSLNGVSVPVSQAVDIYVTYSVTSCGYTGVLPLPCLTATGTGGNPL